MKEMYLCAEIGGTNLRYGVVDELFVPVEFHKTPTSALSDASDKGAYLQELFAPIIEKYGHDSFCCLSLSLASLMDKERTICYSSPNIRGFDGLPLKQILEERLGLPVYLERDVNTALLYEMRKNHITGEGIVAAVYIGTGLGNAISIDGKIYKGSTGSSCELGHIVVPGLDEVCGCGKKGCIELRASGRALRDVAENYGCPVEDIFTLYSQKDEVRDVVKMCAYAVATEVSILDPVCVILGGGVTELPGFPLDYFTETVRENLRSPNPRESLHIVPASGDREAGMVGAAISASSLIQKNEKKGNMQKGIDRI